MVERPKSMKTNYLPLYTAAQTATLDKIAIENEGIPASTLMRRAGASVFSSLMSLKSETKKILVVCGTGNNGGDGYVIARLAKMRGLSVTLIQLGDYTKQSKESRNAREEMEQEGVSIESYARQSFDDYDVIVDALFGIGLQREVSGDWKATIEQINASSAYVVAVDIPSGLAADTGKIMGVAVRADLTVTFIGRKRGLYTADGKSCCGVVRFDALDLPTQVYESQEPDTFLVDSLPDIELFDKRLPNTHKGTYGHVLVVGGAPGMSGAVTMAATAALRSGAGLVSVATHPDHATLINNQQPEIMSHGIQRGDQLELLVKKANIILLGPGLGDSDWAEQLFLQCISTKKTLVIDAHGLHFLARNAAKAENRVLTPHPGEAALLLNTSIEEIQANRFAACAELTQRFGGVAVLKGAGSLTACGNKTYVNASGNPGMASAGMGDVLSGIIAGLIAQARHCELNLHEIVAASVYVHGLAGDLAAEDSGERGLLATDLFPYLRKIINKRV